MLICGLWRQLAEDGQQSSDCDQGKARQPQSGSPPLQTLASFPKGRMSCCGQTCEGFSLGPEQEQGCPCGQSGSHLLFPAL